MKITRHYCGYCYCGRFHAMRTEPGDFSCGHYSCTPPSTRKWIRQHANNRNCGVIAVAVIAGVSVEVAEKAIGKKGCTKTKDLVKGLRKLGFKCANRCMKIPRPRLGIGHLTDPNRKSGWHWVVVDGDKIWDGANGCPDGTVAWEDDWRITSYLPVAEKKK